MTTVITTGTALAPLPAASMETASLPDLEAVIERGQQTFYEVGAALLTIRERRLYRDTHATFEDYCRERWDFSRQRAHQLIQASEVAAMVSTIVDTPLLATESQVREFVPLKDEPEAVAAVWREVTEHAEETGEKITAAAVRAAVREHLEPPEPESAARSETQFVETIPIPARLPGLKRIEIVLDRNDDELPNNWSAADRQQIHIEALLREAEDMLRPGSTLGVMGVLGRNAIAAAEWAPDELPTVLAYTATAVAALREVRRVLHRVDDRNKPARQAEREAQAARHRAMLRAGRTERAKQRKAAQEREG